MRLDLDGLGFKMVVAPIDSLLLTAKAMRDMAQVFARDGHTRSLAGQMVDFDEIRAIVGLDEFLSLRENLTACDFTRGCLPPQKA